ncbi:MAG TPA: DUF4436 family protein [Acidobacteriaceae bacterium]|nr:DUF4436 family protein [Acidobacteriaceae bacterium]
MLGLGFIGVYVTALQRNIHERSERSLELTNNVTAANRVDVDVTVIGADPTTRELTARLRFQLMGDIAKDVATPKVDLRFIVNNSVGQRVFQFPKGETISQIEVVLPMAGDINRYPFDKYETDLWLLMYQPDKSKGPKAPPPPPAALPTPARKTPAAPSTTSAGSDLAEVAATNIATFPNRQVPISISVSASTPGMKYTGEVIRSNDIPATCVRLDLKRPYNLVNASITVMCLMMGIALSIVAMALTAIVSRGEKLDVLPLSLSIGLIFGLPALRNIQPGVPPVGVLGDYFSFVWAEIFVAAAAIIMALTWVFNKKKSPDSKR